MLVLALVAPGCSTSKDAGAYPFDSASSGAELDPGTLRIDVLPSAASGLLPQSELLLPQEYASKATQTLAPTVSVAGTVEGLIEVGWMADVPTVRQPLDAALQIWRDDGIDGGVGTATFDEDGRYNLQVPAGAGYHFSVVPYNGATSPLHYEDDAEFTADTAMDLLLEPGYPLYGRVTDGRGDGVANASLRVHLRDGEVDLASAPFVTDATGWYTTRVPGVGTWQVELMAGGVGGPVFVPQLLVDVVVENEEGGQADIAVAGTAASQVEGTVVDASGDPYYGALVRLTSQELDGGGSYLVETSLPNGTLSEDVLPGRYLLEVYPPAGTADTPFEEVITVGAASHQAGTIVLGAPATLAGQVVDARGNPVAKAAVSAEQVGFGGYVFSGQTNGNGRFTFPVPAGDFEVTVTPQAASASGAIEHFQRSTADGETRYDLPEGTLVERDLRDPDGEPVAYALVYLRAASDGRLLGQGMSNADGYVGLAVAVPEGDTATTPTGDTGDSGDSGGGDSGGGDSAAGDSGAGDSGAGDSGG